MLPSPRLPASSGARPAGSSGQSRRPQSIGLTGILRGSSVAYCWGCSPPNRLQWEWSVGPGPMAPVMAAGPHPRCTAASSSSTRLLPSALVHWWAGCDACRCRACATTVSLLARGTAPLGRAWSSSSASAGRAPAWLCSPTTCARGRSQDLVGRPLPETPLLVPSTCRHTEGIKRLTGGFCALTNQTAVLLGQLPGGSAGSAPAAARPSW